MVNCSEDDFTWFITLYLQVAVELIGKTAIPMVMGLVKLNLQLQ
jgi:hypothetical protein